jgi:AraC-like DNA-binding protein
MWETGPYVKAVTLTDFVECVASLGGDGLAMLDKVGIPRAALKNPDMLIGFRNSCALRELAAEELGRRDFSMIYAKFNAPTFANLGPVALLANFTTNVREWMDTALSYWALHTNGFTYVKYRDPVNKLIALRYTPDSFVLPGRQTTEYAFACIVLMARIACARPDKNPHLIKFQHFEPPDSAPQSSVFRCKIEWGAEHNEIVFEDALLDLPTRGYFSMLKPLMDRHVRKRIECMKGYDQSAGTMIALAIPAIIGSGKCTAETVAQAMGTNLRALQRQLAEEKTTFSDILDKVRHNMAVNYLRESDIPISRIAEILEYSSTAAFTNAFQRWTKSSPLRFRKQSRAKTI